MVLAGLQCRALINSARPDTLHFTFPRDASRLLDAANDARCIALVIEVELLTDEGLQTIAVKAQRNEQSILLLARRTQLAAAQIARAATLAPTRVLFYDAEDVAMLLPQQLRLLAVTSATGLLLRGVAGRFNALPPDLKLALLWLFSGARLPKTLDQVARSAGLSRRSFDRWMDRAGISGGRRLLCAIRLTRAWEATRTGGGKSVRAIARATGYSSERNMCDQFRQSTGTSFDEIVRLRSETELVQELTSWVLERED